MVEYIISNVGIAVKKKLNAVRMALSLRDRKKNDNTLNIEV